jgi:hypothetical protein
MLRKFAAVLTVLTAPPSAANAIDKSLVGELAMVSVAAARYDVDCPGSQPDYFKPRKARAIKFVKELGANAATVKTANDSLDGLIKMNREDYCKQAFLKINWFGSNGDAFLSDALR